MFATLVLLAGAAEWTVEELEQIFQEEGTDKQARDPGHAYVHAYAMRPELPEI